MREVPHFISAEGGTPRYVGTRVICIGAQFRDGQWQPAYVNDDKVLFPYRRFVRSILRAMGYEILI